MRKTLFVILAVLAVIGAIVCNPGTTGSCGTLNIACAQVITC